MKFFVVAAVSMAMGDLGQANAQCNLLPRPVSGYLKIHQKWSVVKLDDLSVDDRELWSQYHGYFCPGIAIASLDDSNKHYYGLALLKKSGGQLLEQFVLINDKSINPSIVTINGPFGLTTPFVVWRTAPGIYKDEKTGRNISIPYDSIVYEKMESVSRQYYLSFGKIHSLLASD